MSGGGLRTSVKKNRETQPRGFLHIGASVQQAVKIRVEPIQTAATSGSPWRRTPRPASPTPDRAHLARLPDATHLRGVSKMVGEAVARSIWTSAPDPVANPDPQRPAKLSDDIAAGLT
jgi:hypothetical protein